MVVVRLSTRCGTKKAPGVWKQDWVQTVSLVIACSSSATAQKVAVPLILVGLW